VFTMFDALLQFRVRPRFSLIANRESLRRIRKCSTREPTTREPANQRTANQRTREPRTSEPANLESNAALIA
jgi:hypothetical protein